MHLQLRGLAIDSCSFIVLLPQSKNNLFNACHSCERNPLAKRKGTTFNSLTKKLKSVTGCWTIICSNVFWPSNMSGGVVFVTQLTYLFYVYISLQFFHLLRTNNTCMARIYMHINPTAKMQNIWKIKYIMRIRQIIYAFLHLFVHKHYL